MLAVTSFEATNFVFSIIYKNSSLSISTPGYWSTKCPEETIIQLKVFLILDLKMILNVKEPGKRGTRVKIEKNGYNLAGFDHLKSEILAKLKRVK